MFRYELNKYVSTSPVDSDNGLLAVVEIFPVVSHSRGKPAHIWGTIIIGVIVIVVLLVLVIIIIL